MAEVVKQVNVAAVRFCYGSSGIYHYKNHLKVLAKGDRVVVFVAGTPKCAEVMYIEDKSPKATKWIACRVTTDRMNKAIAYEEEAKEQKQSLLVRLAQRKNDLLAAVFSNDTEYQIIQRQLNEL